MENDIENEEFCQERKGLYVSVDDLMIGNYFAVVGLQSSDDPVPFAGQSFKITAINLPFFVANMTCDPTTPVTFDTRLFNFMKVDEDFVKAQTPTRTKNSLEAMFSGT